MNKIGEHNFQTNDHDCNFPFLFYDFTARRLHCIALANASIKRVYETETSGISIQHNYDDDDHNNNVARTADGGDALISFILHRPRR